VPLLNLSSAIWSGLYINFQNALIPPDFGFLSTKCRFYNGYDLVYLALFGEF
jgi:hypothetical protein